MRFPAPFRNLGLADVEVRSAVDAGALAASLNGGQIVDSWARGRVRSPDSPRNFRILAA